MDLPSRKAIVPLCRFHLAAWFARKVTNWLVGNFDDVA